MKKVFLFAALFGGVVAMSSCSSGDCCTSAGVEICESDVDTTITGGLSWADYKEVIVAAGGTCD